MRAVGLRRLGLGRPLGDADHRRPQDAVADGVAGLHQRRDIAGRVLAWRFEHRLMEVRIELLTDRLKLFDAMTLQRLEQIAFGQRDAFDQRFGRAVGVLRRAFQRPGDVIGDIEHIAREGRHGVGAAVLHVARRPPTEIFHLGQCAQELVLQFRLLGFERRQRVGRRALRRWRRRLIGFAGGELLGCWFTDIGALNQMLVLRGFVDLATLQAERQRTQNGGNAFGCAAIYQSLTLDSYRAFPWMGPVRPTGESGVQGPVYEIRTYGIKPDGVQPTIDLWQQYVPLREKISPCIVAMIALDGPLRFTNIWAYQSLDARSQARADAVARGIWPPKGGPAWLTTAMTSTIALPTSVSPLR